MATSLSSRKMFLAVVSPVFSFGAIPAAVHRLVVMGTLEDSAVAPRAAPRRGRHSEEHRVDEPVKAVERHPFATHYHHPPRRTREDRRGRRREHQRYRERRLRSGPDQRPLLA